MTLQAEKLPSFTPASILVVEDNPDSRDALRALLEAYGYSVIEATNGKEGVGEALRRKPDLILMDIMMPVMDGLQATRVLRTNSEFRQVPILALTALAGSRDVALDAGCDDYLTKPFNVVAMLTTIREWLARSQVS